MASTPQVMQNRQRPTGVTILAVLYFLGTACLILAGMLLAVGLSFAGTSADQAGATAFLAGMGIVGAVLMFIIAGVYGLLGWGLWSLKSWARLVVLIFAFIGLGFGVLSLMGSMMTMHMGAVVIGLLPIAIHGLVAWYLMQPHVKAAFA